MLLASLLGCARSSSVELKAWTLYTERVPGGAALILPTHFTELVPPGGAPYRLVTHVTVPAALQGERLALFIPYATSLVTLKVNGEPVDATRPPPRNAYRPVGAYEWVLPARATEAGELTLELAGRDDWAQSTWFDIAPRLASSARGDVLTDRVRFINEASAAFGLVAFFQIGFTYLVIFFSSRRRNMYLWLGVAAFMACVYEVWVLGYSQALLGRFDVSVLVVAVSACCIFSIYFTHELFGLPRPSHAWAALLCSVILAGLIDRDATRTSHLLIPVGALSVLASVVHQLEICVRLIRRGNPPRGVYVVLVSWLVVAIPDIHEAIFWLGFGEHLWGVRAPCLSLGLYSLLQSVLLSNEHIFNIRRSDELNLQLASRVSLLETQQEEVQRLNDELRRQVQSRSRQLAEALAGAATGGKRLPVIGDLLQDRYRVVRVIGTGGMGSVFEVLREQDRERLALKVTTEGGATQLARLAREAQVAAQVQHPNVVSIVDVDVAPDGVLYLIMEYVDGPSLEEVRSSFGDVAWALPLLEQVASGLAALHAQGIIHRDLKPANILVSTVGGASTIKITDFGISRFAGGNERAATLAGSAPPRLRAALSAAPRSGSPSTETKTAALGPFDRPTDVDATGFVEAPSTDPARLTQEGFLIGTPAYIPPEASLGPDAVQTPADIFAFGVIAYELLTGTRPFASPPALALIKGLPLAPARRIEELTRSALEPALADVLTRCVSFESAVRPTATELLAAFARLRPPKAA